MIVESNLPKPVRFKGSTLKTVFMMKTMKDSTEDSRSLENVNRIRIQIGLSPVKKLEKGRCILNCFELFFDQGNR